MKVLRLAVKPECGFNAFGTTCSTVIQFSKMPGASGAPREDIRATYRPDLACIALEKEGFPPFCLPMGSIKSFDVEFLPAETLGCQHGPAQDPAAKEHVCRVADEAPAEPEKKRGRPSRVLPA